MKPANTKSSIIILAVVTALLCIVISIVNFLTAPKIAEYSRAKEASSTVLVTIETDFKTFFGDATSYEKLGDTLFHDSSALCFCVVNGSKRIGYAVYGFGKGYQSIIRVAVGLNPDFSIRGIKILDQAETEGLGTRILEDDFIQQFSGKQGDQLHVITTADSSENAIMAITAATISSRALAEDAIKNAILFCKLRAGRQYD